MRLSTSQAAFFSLIAVSDEASPSRASCAWEPGAGPIVDVVVGDRRLRILPLPGQRLGQQKLRVIGAGRGAVGQHLPRCRLRGRIVAAGQGGIAFLQRQPRACADPARPAGAAAAVTDGVGAGP